MTLQRGLAVTHLLNLPPPSVVLQLLTVSHTLCTLCVYTYICTITVTYHVYVAYTVFVYARIIYALNHAQRGLCVNWVYQPKNCSWISILALVELVILINIRLLPPVLLAVPVTLILVMPPNAFTS